MLLFMIQSLAHASAEGGSFTIQAMWESSGFIARSVIITLILMLFWTFVVSIERILAFNRARNESMRLQVEVVKPLQAGDLNKALAIAQDEQYKSSYLAAILSAGIKEMAEQQSEQGLSNAMRAIDKAVHEETSKMRRGMTVLATVGSTAPFVGLFGTTFGVINAFNAMGEGTGLSDISAGIAEALITTGVGIGVAVVGVWMFNYFNMRADKVRDELTSSESDFLAWGTKQLQSNAAEK